jgi:hypothetical protein
LKVREGETKRKRKKKAGESSPMDAETAEFGWSNDVVFLLLNGTQTEKGPPPPFPKKRRKASQALLKRELSGYS